MKNIYNLILKNSARTEQGDYCVKFKNQKKKTTENLPLKIVKSSLCHSRENWKGKCKPLKSTIENP